MTDWLNDERRKERTNKLIFIIIILLIIIYINLNSTPFSVAANSPNLVVGVIVDGAGRHALPGVVVVGPGPSRHTTYLLQARGVLSARTLLDVQLLQHQLTAECVQDLVEILRNIGYRFRAAKQQSRDI